MQIITIGGLELRFLQSKQETCGSVDIFEMALQPNARMPLPHHHESWDETIYGLVGVTMWTVGGEAIAIAPGQSLFIKRGTVHGFQNNTATAAKCLCILTPGALGPAYFQEMAELVASGSPDPQRMKATMLRYGLVPAP
jgi:quercetin dioxygenase-like cupin family protein